MNARKEVLWAEPTAKCIAAESGVSFCIRYNGWMGLSSWHVTEDDAWKEAAQRIRERATPPGIGEPHDRLVAPSPDAREPTGGGQTSSHLLLRDSCYQDAVELCSAIAVAEGDGYLKLIGKVCDLLRLAVSHHQIIPRRK